MLWKLSCYDRPEERTGQPAADLEIKTGGETEEGQMKFALQCAGFVMMIGHRGNARKVAG